MIFLAILELRTSYFVLTIILIYVIWFAVIVLQSSVWSVSYESFYCISALNSAINSRLFEIFCNIDKLHPCLVYFDSSANIRVMGD
jgi:hypothetical protein